MKQCKNMKAKDAVAYNKFNGQNIISLKKKTDRFIYLDMNNRSKNKIRNASNSRQSRSNLASNSKEKITITKYKSQKNLFFKNKNSSQNTHSKSKQNSKNTSRSGYQNFAESRPLKVFKAQLPSEEYYTHAKKAKSKTKINEQHQQEIQRQKKSYFQSLYMHKEDQDHLQDVLQNSFQKTNDRANSPLNSNLKMIKKIKMIEKHAAIDVNGKFVQKQPKKTERKADSQQHTFSVFQNTKNSIAANTQLQSKKSSQNLKMKKDKMKIKTKNSQLYEAELIAHNKSAMKSVLKLKKHTSNGKDPKDIKEYKQDFMINKNPAQIPEIKKVRSTRDGTRMQTQRETIQTSSTKTIQSAETDTSPQFMVKNNFLSCLSTALVSFDEVIKQVEQEKQNLKILRATITNSDYLQERIKSIDFIGKICHLMSVKRQAHSLAVIFLDNYIEHIISSIMKDKQKRKLFKLNQQTINFPELIKNLRLFAITCLILALKMDDGLMARKLCFQLNTNLEGLLKSSQSKINQKMKESIAQLNGYNTTSTTKQSRKQSVYSLSKSKTNITSISSARSIDQKESRKVVKKQEPSNSQLHNIDMNSIIKVETDILLKFKFKLSVKSPQYWIDMFTFLWDDYINAQVSWEQMLYFRENDSTANISQLLQLLQKTYLNLEVYQFPTFTIILAIMYLIIRIKLEQQKQCQNQKTLFEKYRQNLMKSTNIVFYDNIGINQLYGDFLTQLNLSLSDIVNAVKYVGQFLTYENLKSFSFNNKSKQVNNRYDLHQHRLSLYQYNAEIYASALK